MVGGSKVHDNGRYDIVYIDSVGDMAVLGTSPVLADIVAKVPEERPGQGDSAIIESEWPVL
jgi:hypothetical protein